MYDPVRPSAAAEDNLLKVENTGQPQFAVVLLKVVASDSFSMPVRKSGALFFKNFIKRQWVLVDEDGRVVKNGNVKPGSDQKDSKSGSAAAAAAGSGGSTQKLPPGVVDRISQQDRTLIKQHIINLMLSAPAEVCVSCTDDRYVCCIGSVGRV